MQPQVTLAEQLNTGIGADERLFLSKDGIFNTIQGEGPRLGQYTTFMRLAGCNLACSWCDTAYTWDWTGKNGHKYYPQDEVVSTLESTVYFRVRELTKSTRSLTITGGEPLLQWKRLQELFYEMKDSGSRPFDIRALREVNFETNGTIWPTWEYQALEVADQLNYVVSPKLKNSGNALLDQGAAVPTLIYTLSHFVTRPGGSDFKFVCASEDDLEEVEEIQQLLEVWEQAKLPDHRIWIMPQGVEPGLVNNRARELVEATMRRGWNLTTRFHLQLWGNERAR